MDVISVVVLVSWTRGASRSLLDGLGLGLGSRVVSVLDSGAEGPGSNRSRDAVGNSLRQSAHTHCASVQQAAKLLAALLREEGPICVIVPNLIKIGQTVAEIWRFNCFQNGGRPPSWICEIRIF